MITQRAHRGKPRMLRVREFDPAIDTVHITRAKTTLELAFDQYDRLPRWFKELANNAPLCFSVENLTKIYSICSGNPALVRQVLDQATIYAKQSKAKKQGSS